MDVDFVRAIDLKLLPLIEIKFKAGADIDQIVTVDEKTHISTYTLLEYFTSGRKWDQVLWLLNHGASVDLHKHYSFALFSMFCLGYPVVALPPATILTRMILAGSDIHFLDPVGKSCIAGLLFRKEFSEEHLPVMVQMIHAGAKIDEQGRSNLLNTSLISEWPKYNPGLITQVITYLLHKGAKISVGTQENKYRGTIEIAQEYHPNLVALLQADNRPPLTPRLMRIEAELQKLKQKLA